MRRILGDKFRNGFQITLRLRGPPIFMYNAAAGAQVVLAFNDVNKRRGLLRNAMQSPTLDEFAGLLL